MFKVFKALEVPRLNLNGDGTLIYQPVDCQVFGIECAFEYWVNVPRLSQDISMSN